MKKALALILAMFFVFATAACESAPAPAPANPDNSSDAAPSGSGEPASNPSTLNQDNLIILGGSSSAVWAIAAAQVGEMIKEIYPDKTVNVEPGGAIANYNSVNSGDAQIGLCITCTSWEAWNGASETFPEPLQNVRSWGISWPMVLHIVATDKSGIQTVDQMKGKNVSMSFPGQTAYVINSLMLKLHGLDILSDVKLSVQEASDAMTSMGDGQLDVYSWNHSIPQASITELALNNDVHFVEWGEGKLDKFVTEYPQYAKLCVPAGTYTFSDQDYWTVGVVTDLIVHKDMDEEFVYQMTKAYWEQQERFLNIMPEAQRYATLENCMKDLIVPLHPGAYRYYVERGCQIPDAIKTID